MTHFTTKLTISCTQDWQEEPYATTTKVEHGYNETPSLDEVLDIFCFYLTQAGYKTDKQIILYTEDDHFQVKQDG